MEGEGREGGWRVGIVKNSRCVKTSSGAVICGRRGTDGQRRGSPIRTGSTVVPPGSSKVQPSPSLPPSLLLGPSRAQPRAAPPAAPKTTRTRGGSADGRSGRGTRERVKGGRKGRKGEGRSRRTHEPSGSPGMSGSLWEPPVVQRSALCSRYHPEEHCPSPQSTTLP